MFSINGTWTNTTGHCADCLYIECHMLGVTFVIVMLNIIMLSVAMLSVVAPINLHERRKCYNIESRGQRYKKIYSHNLRIFTIN
jgi:hypothetical protein